MADVKISALPAASTPLAGTEVLPIVQSTATKKVSIADVTAGRAISTAGVTDTSLTASKPVFTDAAKKLTSNGTLATDQGGTGLTSFTANGVVYASSASALATGSAITFDGQNLSISGYLNTNNNNISADNSLGFRNRIINGDMRIDQRNAGAAVTYSGGTVYNVDRFLGAVSGSLSGAFTVQQDSDAPPTFINSIKITVTTAAASITGADVYVISQRIEGTNVSDLAFGTANAKTVTLSFWVRSSLTGTFGGSLRNSANNRSYPFTYSISVADTWEYKTVTIAGDTSGTWLTTTGTGINVTFAIGTGPDRTGTAGAWNSNNNGGATGQTQIISTLNATWYVTGVQLEVGSKATPFERKPYGTELALCQRYYYKVSTGSASGYLSSGGQWYGTTSGAISTPFPVTMRTKPTALEQSGTAGHYAVLEAAGGGRALNAVPTFQADTTVYLAVTNFSTAAGGVAGGSTNMYSSNASAYLAWSAEL